MALGGAVGALGAGLGKADGAVTVGVGVGAASVGVALVGVAVGANQTSASSTTHSQSLASVPALKTQSVLPRAILDLRTSV